MLGQHILPQLNQFEPKLCSILPSTKMSSNGVVSVDDLLKESKAEYRQLGKSGLRVSVPILGAMSFGDKKWLPWVLDEDEALPLLKAAYDKGINTWDTGAYSLSWSKSNM